MNVFIFYFNTVYRLDYLYTLFNCIININIYIYIYIYILIFIIQLKSVYK